MVLVGYCTVSFTAVQTVSSRLITTSIFVARWHMHLHLWNSLQWLATPKTVHWTAFEALKRVYILVEGYPRILFQVPYH